MASAEKLVADTEAKINVIQAEISQVAAAQDYAKAAHLKKEKETHAAFLSKAQDSLAAAKTRLHDAQQARRTAKLGEGTPFAAAAAKESLASYSVMIENLLQKWKPKIDAAVAVVSTAISHAVAHGSSSTVITSERPTNVASKPSFALIDLGLGSNNLFRIGKGCTAATSRVSDASQRRAVVLPMR